MDLTTKKDRSNYAKEYYLKNKEKKKQYYNTYYIINRERIKEYNKSREAVIPHEFQKIIKETIISFD